MAKKARAARREAGSKPLDQSAKSGKTVEAVKARVVGGFLGMFQRPG